MNYGYIITELNYFKNSMYIPRFLLLILYFLHIGIYGLGAWKAIAPSMIFMYFMIMYAGHFIIIDEIIHTIYEEDTTHIIAYNCLVMKKLKSSIRRYSFIKWYFFNFKNHHSFNQHTLFFRHIFIFQKSTRSIIFLLFISGIMVYITHIKCVVDVRYFKLLFE